jgi:hypothetical protein
VTVSMKKQQTAVLAATQHHMYVRPLWTVAVANVGRWQSIQQPGSSRRQHADNPSTAGDSLGYNLARPTTAPPPPPHTARSARPATAAATRLPARLAPLLRPPLLLPLLWVAPHRSQA